MTTYNTYQEAKIAMPLACIIHNTEDGYFLGMPSREGTTLNDDGCIFAEPQDYCMTVEAFLDGGNKFVEGDLLLDIFGGFITVGNEYSVVGANNKADSDNKRHILRAAALEEKTKRTKVELKSANYAAVSSAIKAHEDGVEFVRLLPDGGVEDLSWFGLCECFANGYKVRVKAHVEIDERQEFIDVCMKSANLRSRDGAREVYGDLYDSGKFKLVEGE